jgi:hypothetical protein
MPTCNVLRGRWRDMRGHPGKFLSPGCPGSFKYNKKIDGCIPEDFRRDYPIVRKPSDRTAYCVDFKNKLLIDVRTGEHINMSTLKSDRYSDFANRIRRLREIIDTSVVSSKQTGKRYKYIRRHKDAIDGLD